MLNNNMIPVTLDRYFIKEKKEFKLEIGII